MRSKMMEINGQNGTTPKSKQPMVITLTAAHAPLEWVGGKGANLVKLAQAGLPVPQAFLLTTRCYRHFVEHNLLAEMIAEEVAVLPLDDPAALEQISHRIRTHFTQGELPAPILDAVADAYMAMKGAAVAVRSSATAEDLPEMSFAGQQDTYLNVLGFDNLQTAIVNCWGSLWTARAMAYRARNAIDQDQVALSVVVQAMVQSEASGVLFTANPLTGKRSETVIDATLGLGEALVSGQVTPDHYVVESQSGRILRKELGEKALSIRSQADGGVITVTETASTVQALPDTAIQELLVLGRRIQTLYPTPQDVEWAWAQGELTILQSRPITSLFPIPATRSDRRQGELDIYFSMGAVQGMLDPMTPLGRDAIMNILSGGAALFGMTYDYRSQTMLDVAGERIYVRINPFLGSRLGQGMISRALGGVEAGAAQALASLRDEIPVPAATLPSPEALGRIVRGMGALLPGMRRTLINPDSERQDAQRFLDAYVARIQAQAQRAGSLVEIADLMDKSLTQAFPTLGEGLLPRLGPGMGTLFLSISLAHRFLGDQIGQTLPNPLEITRGLPNNVTTEMDLTLWTVADIIRRDRESAQIFASTTAESLAASYLAGALPLPAQVALTAFLQRYGMRGLAEFDIGRTRWRENPVPVMQTVQSYLQITDPDLAPAAVFAQGAIAAGQTIEELAQAVTRTPMGGIKARLLRFVASRARSLSGLRETPKFTMIRILGIFRQRLLDLGAELATQGVVEQATDLFFLHIHELREMGNGRKENWQALITERRGNYQRELLRRQTPRLLLSDGRAFYEGVRSSGDEGADILVGTPVSPGQVEGRVRVVFDPHTANLTPGEILVCPGTDPAWTPLFLAAGGLVMEVGGLMTHGSVVAREYGIPAVVGVNQATSRLQTGQRIRVDGASGRVRILEQTEEG